MREKIIIIIEGELLETKAMKETGAGHMTDKTEVITEGTIEVSVIVGQGQLQEQDRIRCFECKEYDHFTRDYPATQVDREVEQIQQVFNMDKNQTILQTPLMDIDQVRQIISPTEAREN